MKETLDEIYILELILKWQPVKNGKSGAATGMVKYRNGGWKKCLFLLRFFEISKKELKTILIKKVEWSHRDLV